MRSKRFLSTVCAAVMALGAANINLLFASADFEYPDDAVFANGGSSWSGVSFESLKETDFNKWDGIWWGLGIPIPNHLLVPEGETPTFTVDTSEAIVVVELKLHDDVNEEEELFRYIDTTDGTNYTVKADRYYKSGENIKIEFSYDELWQNVDNETYHAFVDTDANGNEYKSGFGCNLQICVDSTVSSFITGYIVEVDDDISSETSDDSVESIPDWDDGSSAIYVDSTVDSKVAESKADTISSSTDNKPSRTIETSGRGDLIFSPLTALFQVSYYNEDELLDTEYFNPLLSIFYCSLGINHIYYNTNTSTYSLAMDKSADNRSDTNKIVIDMICFTDNEYSLYTCCSTNAGLSNAIPGVLRSFNNSKDTNTLMVIGSDSYSRDKLEALESVTLDITLYDIRQRLLDDEPSLDITLNTKDSEIASQKFTMTVDGGSKTESENASVEIPEMADGKHVLKFESEHFVAREYEVTVQGGEIIDLPEIKLNLVGDINGDGDIKATDLLLDKSHIKGVGVLTGYELKCADIDGNGKVNAADLLKLKAHIKGVTKLW